MTISTQLTDPRPPPTFDSNDKWMRGFLAFAIVAMVAGIVYMMFTRQIPDASREIAGTVVGVMLAILKDVYTSTFGTSASTAKKDATIADIAKSAQTVISPPATITVTPPPTGDTT